MLPSKTSFQLTSGQASPVKVMTLKLPEDLARKLLHFSPSHPAPKLRLELDHNNPAQNRLLLGDDDVPVAFPIIVTAETQTVDVARSNMQRKTMRIVGKVKEKLAVKQELASEKASAIRAQSAQAEKERLSRKTMTIDEPIKGSVASRAKVKVSSAAPVSSRNRLLQRVSGGKKVASSLTASPRPARPVSAQQASSERLDKSSTHTWSPPIDVFSKPPEPSAVEEPPRKARKSSSVPGVRPLPEILRESVDPVYSQLLARFQAKAQEYKTVEQWVDRRLSIFEQLQKDLSTASGNQSATDRITHRVEIETIRLAADKEYKWKLAELEQLRGELEDSRTKLQAYQSPSL